MMSRWPSLILGVVLIITTFQADALSKEILLKLSGLSDEGKIMKDPITEKIVYPLPPGVTPLTLSKEAMVLKPENNAFITESPSSTEEIMSKKPSEIIELQPSTEGSPVTHMNPSKKESTPPTEGPVFTEPIHFTIPTATEVIRHTEATTLHVETTLVDETTQSAKVTPPVQETTSSPIVPEPISNLKACTTPFGKHGECKDIHFCPSLVKLIKREPLLAENKLYLQRSQCGFENKTVLACCPDNVPEPIISPKWSLIPKPGKCGTMSENRLYGGYTTEIDSYKWSTLLQYSKGGNEMGFHCGGALINNRYILTAAHCVRNLPETWSLKSVRLGEWDIATNMDCDKFNEFKDCADPHLNVGIEEIIPHKDYVPTSNNKLHDIALIRLSSQVNRTDFIEPICLPHGENNLHGFDDQSLDLAGWGASPEGLWNNIKQRVSAPVIPLNNCRRKYTERNIQLEPSQFCIEGRIKNDTCRLDSGGPVISFDTSNKGLGSYYIAGIQSFGPSPCWQEEEGLPGVYTRVGEYLDWILDNIHI